MTNTVALSQLPAAQAIKPASGTLTLDGTIIGATNKQAATFTSVSADSVTSPLGSFTVVSASTPITGSSGGTGNAFTTFTGPASALKTFTLPNASSTILTSNSVVTVVQGGTGLATLTANNVILGNGTSAPTFVAPGANGNVLTSNGTTWQSSPSASGTGAMIKLSSQTASSSTIIAFTSGIDATYKQYMIIGTNITLNFSSASANDVLMQGSIDGGATYLSTASYTNAELTISAASATAGAGGTTSIRVIQNLERQSSSTGANGNFIAYIFNPSDATSYKGVKVAGMTNDPVSGVLSLDTAGTIKTASAVNAIRFTTTGTNIATGTFTLYGIS